MNDPAKTPSRSPEVEAFRREYNDFLRYVDRPVELAHLLFSEDVVSSETKDAITSDEDEDGKRILLDAVEHALVHASDREAKFQSLVRALEKVYEYTNYLTNSVDVEQINRLSLKLISGEKGTCMGMKLN